MTRRAQSLKLDSGDSSVTGLARPLRISIPHGVYHVTVRGNNRQRIYLDDSDRIVFLELLAHVVERYGWLCHAYCLMDNHYHLVVETPRANLATGMRQLNGLYAQRFNRRHRRCGHLYQGRYHAILVDKDSYLLAVCRYVVRNPCRAGICDDPGDYPWSSYRATAGLAPAPPFLTTDELLGMLAPDRGRAQARYRELVASGNDEPLPALGQRLGPEPLLRNRFGHNPPLAEIPRVQIEPLRRPLAEIFESSTSPIATAYREHGYTLREIADHLNRHYTTISRRLRTEEQQLPNA